MCLTRSLTAHPRVGGENVAVIVSRRSMSGSSPRGRGKRWSLRGFLVVVGLIPAWAGKTLSFSFVEVQGAAHPRVGGENAEPKRDPLGVTGSSPRGRGKLSPWLPCGWCPRLIPA